MADTSDFRNGMVLEIDGGLVQIVYFQHVKPGKGGAFVRTKLKHVFTGAVVERTFRAGERDRQQSAAQMRGVASCLAPQVFAARGGLWPRGLPSRL